MSAAAREAERVIPHFVLDDVLLRGPCGSPNRLSFLLGCLHDLHGALRERDGRLVLRRGDPVKEALRVAREAKTSAIHLSDDYSAYACRRRERLANGCERDGMRLRVHPGVTVVEPGELLPTGGDHYRVFTPYWRGWSEQLRRKLHPAPRRLSLPAGVRVGQIPALRRLTDAAPSPELPQGGETAARKRLERWLHGGLAEYEDGRDQLAADGTSHLSADLHFGCLSPTTVLDRVEGRLGAAHFERLLVDADIANNSGNWQWVAGTGNDTRPNRVLNPLRQAHRFDPEGEYVRRYVPELAAVEGAQVHEPWLLHATVRQELDYPDPVVDHEEGAVQFRRFRESGSG